MAENILSFLDARSLCAAELVSKEWLRKVNRDSLWKGLADRRGGFSISSNLNLGNLILLMIKCRSENSKGVYCLQVDTV